jgi:imidazolonepropionase-like amidohydrolase
LRLRFTTPAVFGGCLLAGALAVSNGPITPAQTQTLAIVGGTVHPASGPRLERATVLIRDGRIAAVGTDVAIPADAQRIDAAGKWVTPGLMNVVSVVGLVEIPLGGGATDERALGRNNIAAAFRPWEAFDAASPLIASTRNDGITTIGLMPAGNLVSGQHALVDLSNGRGETMLRKAPSAMVVRVQEAAPAGAASRGELIGKLRTLLEEARDWPGLRVAVQENRSRPLSASVADFEALQPVIAGTLPLLVVVDRAAEIDAVLRLVGEFKVRAILANASEAWQRAPELAAAGIPVIVGGIRNIPDSFDRLNTRDDNAAILRRAGVTVILESDSYGDGNHFNVRNVRFEAGNAVANGMTWDDALRAVTAVPAEVFGVADRVGTLRPDMDANVVVWSGDPFEFASRAEAVIIGGARVDAPSRQDELMERYRTLPPGR